MYNICVPVSGRIDLYYHILVLYNNVIEVNFWSYFVPSHHFILVCFLWEATKSFYSVSSVETWQLWQPVVITSTVGCIILDDNHQLSRIKGLLMLIFILVLRGPHQSFMLQVILECFVILNVLISKLKAIISIYCYKIRFLSTMNIILSVLI